MMQSRPPQPRLPAGVAQKQATRRYVERILGDENIRVPALAKRAGIAASTLYRIMDESDPFTPSLRTVDKIEVATGYPFGGAAGQLELAEPEAVFVSAEDHPVGLTLAADEGLWRLGSRVVELAGFLPGDFIVFGIGEPARSGDLVVAQVETRQGSAETVIRIYEAPYLMARTLDPSAGARPLPVDGETVRIAGRFRRMLRLASVAEAVDQSK